MPKAFVPPGTPRHYVADRPVAVQHVKLDVELDFPAKAIFGRVTLDLVVRADEARVVTLDAVDMEIDDVRVDTTTARSSYDGTRLRIELPRTQKRDARFSLSVSYRATPRRGLYFLAPDAHTPDRPLQCWTQGQDEDTRHYVPCLDIPIEKATSEVICVAPAGRTVLSNGDLVERVDVDDTKTRWHYRLEVPQPSYLITLVCGTFSEDRDRAPETGVDVFYFGPPGREADTRRSLGRTPAMIDFFSRRIGVRYPHRRYSQVVVADFIFGGMENTTATTLTDLALVDERAALDHDVESLVAHELAHQWWGDLVTCREWSEAWLNEGFATYFEYVWREHAHGRDEADIELRHDLDGYLGEADHYQRPIVCRHYEEPIELFDAHLYEKGGRVLHMVRNELGDQLFFSALRTYAERHAHGSVETRDLARALEDTTGRAFERFFDDWVRRAGHPDIDAGWDWDDDRKVGSFRIKQTQGEGDKDDKDRLYTFKAVLDCEVAGVWRTERFTVTERSHVFEVHLPERPTQVIFDPGDVLLKTVKMEKARPLWTRQLEAARLAVDRVLAARALGDKPEPAAVAALGKALESDPFWAVRAAAATALGETRRKDALSVLLAARTQTHPKVRRAIASALGNWKGDADAANALVTWIEAGDPSCFVEASAARALGQTRSPRALTVLPTLFTRKAFQDVIRARAIDGVGDTGDGSEAAADAGLKIVAPLYDARMPFQVRRAAINAGIALAEGTPHARRARELAEAGLGDDDFRVRMDAAGALARLGDARALPALEHARAAELDGRAKRRIALAVDSLREGSAGGEVRHLRDELSRLRGESDRLRERVEVLERARGAAAAGPPPGTTTPRGAKTRSRRPRPPTRRTPKGPRRH